MFVVLLTSLSHDPILKPFNHRGNAVSEMLRNLTREGWPHKEAAEAAEKGSPVLLADDGNGSEIRIVALAAGD